MSKLSSLFKIPNYLDVVLILLLIARLLLGVTITTLIVPSRDFGEVAEAALNPFSGIDHLFADPDFYSLLLWFCNQLQGALLFAVVILILTGQKKSAAFAAVGFSILPTLVLPFIAAVFSTASYGSNFFYVFGYQYSFNGYVFDSSYNMSFNGGVYALEHMYKGLGLVFVLSFIAFYLLRQFPRSAKESRTALQVSELQALRTKSDFCPRCGNASTDGDYCAKCGNSLWGVSNQVGDSISYPAGRTSPLATAAVISVFFVSWVGIVLGYLARKEIRESNGQLGGESLVKVAIVFGWFATGLGVLVAIIWASAIGVEA